jgi:protein CpxP
MPLVITASMRQHTSSTGPDSAPLAHLVHKLDLTDEQRQSLRSLLESARANSASLRAQQRAHFEASLTTLPDSPNYPALIEERKQLAAAAIQQRSDLNVQIYALLTPEQKAKIPSLIEDMKAKAKERRADRPRRDRAAKKDQR